MPNNMKKYLLLLALCTLYGCRSANQMNLKPTHHDSLYHANVVYDSIYLYKDRLVYQLRDTVYLKETEVEYRYRLLHDTVQLICRDSIPYPVTVIQTQEVKYIPWYLRVLSCMGSVWLVLLLAKGRKA